MKVAILIPVAMMLAAPAAAAPRTETAVLAGGASGAWNGCMSTSKA